MNAKLTAILLGAAMLVASPVLADTTWNFGSPTGTLGTSQTYTSNGITITATGWSPWGSPNALYGNMAGGDENGLGIAWEFNHEISKKSFVNLDLSNLVNQGILTGDLIISSVQSQEGYNICFGSAAGNLGSVNCFTGNLDNTPFTINWTNANPIVGITATSGSVLVSSLTYTTPTEITQTYTTSTDITQTNTPPTDTTPVPEPATLTLLGPGAVLLGLLRRRLASRV